MRRAISLFVIISAVSVCPGAVITVDDDGPADFNNIQDAIDDANDGDIVEVQPGIYTGDGNRDIDFLGKAITVRSTKPDDPNIIWTTIIDCGGSSSERHRGFHFHNGEDANSIVEGLTIQNGWAPIEDVNGIPINESKGGGIYCCESSPLIKNCVITNNMASKRGIIDDTVGLGAGICCLDSNSIIIGCLIKDNGALCGIPEPQFPETFWGGGICIIGGNLRINNCRITGNAACFGGGINCAGLGMNLSNCVINNNRSTISGSALDLNGNITVVNFTINKNESFNNGATIICRSSEIEINNCVIWDNVCLAEIDGEPIVSRSDIEGGWPGEGNINLDPLFANADNDEYHLQSQAGRWDANSQSWVMDSNTSPCIDAGDWMSPIGNEPFPNGGRINMGAYGGTAEASKSYFGEPPCKTIIAGDINGDCMVNFIDFAIMALHWQQEGN